MTSYNIFNWMSGVHLAVPLVFQSRFTLVCNSPSPTIVVEVVQYTPDISGHESFGDM